MSSTSTPSVKKLAIRGAVWTIFGYGSSQILRFGSNLILTRLLFPELFGLMALVGILIAGLHLFSDLGLNASIIQSKRGDDPTFLNTAWTLQVLRGVVLWLCCLGIAYPSAQFYHEPRLLWLIPLVGVSTLIGGFGSTALSTLNRHLALKYITLFELGGQLIALIVTLVWAWLSPSVLSLIAGGLVASVIQTILSHRLNGEIRNRFTWDPSAVKELLSFGKWIFLSTAIFFLSSSTDRLILGKLFTLQQLGVYGIALTLAEVPRSIVFAVATKVIYPAYSKFVDLPRSEFRAKIVEHRRPMLIALAVANALIVGLGDLIISSLYDDRYTAASWMFPMLAIGMWPLVLIQTIDQGLWALGKPNYWTFGSFLSFLCYAIGIPFGFHSPLHEVGAVLAVAVSNVPIWVVVMYGLWREKLLALRQDLSMTALFLALLGLVIAIRISIGSGSPFGSFGAGA
ncbi:oligosaccharide flippase family protein [Stenomitos frigidus]|uniref:Polysaccharide biosynthesis protein n=1 Tax=Stenomitos frigidus ULC18 TaxID=2107698 RepID=A0A2T1DZK6_9CYAN|nr:oligosaccharide flippase family protein [Stenomitos frigidus]PSB25926.1 polysaccharide biosynthesis protein [Stenomitos frigidus ULC18]